MWRAAAQTTPLLVTRPPSLWRQWRPLALRLPLQAVYWPTAGPAVCVWGGGGVQFLCVKVAAADASALGVAWRLC
jgi:hypothetical protein